MSAQTTDLADMPKADAYFCEMPSDPCVIVMFGASGDLAKRKLLARSIRSRAAFLPRSSFSADRFRAHRNERR